MANLLIIRDLCKSKKITIRELAKKVEIGEAALQALIKNGSTNTTTLEKIAQVLDVPVGVFFDGYAGSLSVNVPQKQYDGEPSELLELLREKDRQIDRLMTMLENEKSKPK